MRTCEKCGKTLPLEVRRGPKRRKCADCAPSRPRKVEKPRVKPVAATQKPSNCVEATRIALRESGQEHAPLGFAVLALAARIDSGEEVGAALASLVKQYGASIASLSPQAAVEMDPLQKLLSGDELAVRRERRPG